MMRAHVRLDVQDPRTARQIRQDVLIWHESRHGLERPNVQHVTAPAPVGGWDQPERFVLVQLVAPTPEDLLALADVLRPYGQPHLTLTRDPVGLQA